MIDVLFVLNFLQPDIKEEEKAQLVKQVTINIYFMLF